jgi:hypothetical protein
MSSVWWGGDYLHVRTPYIIIYCIPDGGALRDMHLHVCSVAVSTKIEIWWSIEYACMHAVANCTIYSVHVAIQRYHGWPRLEHRYTFQNVLAPSETPSHRINIQAYPVILCGIRAADCPHLPASLYTLITHSIGAALVRAHHQGLVLAANISSSYNVMAPSWRTTFITLLATAAHRRSAKAKTRMPTLPMRNMTRIRPTML